MKVIKKLFYKKLRAGGKIMLQCNGREILIRIEHPGINIKKL